MIPTISVQELKERLEANDDFHLLDVRQPEEHAAQRVQDGHLIPLGELMDRKSELEEYREKEIVVYCRSGNRSGQAVEYLRHLGFNATNVKGGILAWQALQESA